MLLNATEVGLISAAIMAAVLTVVLLLKLPNRLFHWSLLAATAFQSLWGFGLALAGRYSLSLETVVVLELLRTSIWTCAAARALLFFNGCGASQRWRLTLWFLAICYVLFGVAYTGQWLGSSPLAWQFLLLTAMGLVAVFELHRQVRNIRFVELLCLNLAAQFAFDLYFFASELFNPDAEQINLQLRSGIALIFALFLGLAAITFDRPQNNPSRLSLSRPAVFYVMSLALTGFLVSALILGSYYAQRFSGDWGLFIYAALLLSALAALLYVIVFKHARETLRVLINKHLFSHKYDYRSEWLRLIEKLSQPMAAEHVHRHAFDVMAAIFRAPGGALWLRHGKVFVPVYQTGVTLDVATCIEPDASAFVDTLRHKEWVFLPRGSNHEKSLAQFNEHLPDWVRAVDNLWLIMPLLSETQLVGFMLLTEPDSDTSLNWEDLDLLKTVGRQVANYLRRHEQSEQLAEARQFDAFNKLAAYVMHDLKNLIAQQSLVVTNAERHKDNPAFVEDAINTINNSVIRMNTLLRKLQRNEPETTRVLSLESVVIEAVKRCQKRQPKPILRGALPNGRVKADIESLVMVFVHLIQNAQDATPAGGFVDVVLSGDGRTSTVTIEDNGSGMDETFIRERLFKPFDTTKTGKGMGIGVYQARDYVKHLGGHISVESTLGEGTSFIICLPALQHAESAQSATG